MEKSVKIFLLFFCLFSNFLMFAQDLGFPGSETPNGDLNGADAPPAPIDNLLILLVVLALVLAYYKIKKSQKYIENHSN